MRWQQRSGPRMRAWPISKNSCSAQMKLSKDHNNDIRTERTERTDNVADTSRLVCGDRTGAGRKRGAAGALPQPGELAYGDAAKHAGAARQTERPDNPEQRGEREARRRRGAGSPGIRSRGARPGVEGSAQDQRGAVGEAGRPAAGAEAGVRSA